jgi:hypothetical protein
MQQLTLNQLQAISGGASDSTAATISNLIYETSGAFQKGLSPSELGVGVVSFAIGAGLASLNRGYVVRGAGLALVAGYAAYSYFKPDMSGFSLSSVTGLFGNTTAA